MRAIGVPVFPLASVLIAISCAHETEGDTSAVVIDRIAFGSCAMQWEEQPIWDAVIATEPDLFLFLGDAIYGDWDGERVVPATRQSLERDWGKLAAIPGFARLREFVPIMATWDNHDYGSHNGGAEFELQEISKEIFLDFFGEPAGSGRRKRPGVYEARIFGPPGRRVQVILLDTRYFKGSFVKDKRSKEEKAALGIVGRYAPNPDPEVTLLGEEQWEWLEGELRKPAEIRFVASSTQIVPDEKGMDEWGNYPHERRKLFDLIRKTGALGTLMLSGNVHFAEISRFDDGPYPLHDFTSSGLTHVNPAYAKARNSYRVAGPYADLNFGVVEIDWRADPDPVIVLKAMSKVGDVVFAYETSLGALVPTSIPEKE
jgi:alkaline phosphatase D